MIKSICNHLNLKKLSPRWFLSFQVKFGEIINCYLTLGRMFGRTLHEVHTKLILSMMFIFIIIYWWGG